MAETARQYPAAKRQIKFIHWAASDLKWDDETRRDFCQKVTGKRSTLEMSHTEAGKMIQALKSTYAARGLLPPWQRPKPIKPGRKVQTNLQWHPSWLKVRPASCDASQWQLTIIRDRWLAMAKRGFCKPDKLQESLDAFLLKRFGIEGIHRLKADEAKGVVKAVILMEERSR